MAKNILIIDDEELVSQSLRRLLKKEGYNALIAKSGSEAIEIVKETELDLIISDVRMPGLDGIETITQIRAILENLKKKPIPEIIITGYADADKYEKAGNLEVVDYLYKPFDNAEFLRVIKKSIG
jgi:CheY-like chemotaxis protein